MILDDAGDVLVTQEILHRPLKGIPLTTSFRCGPLGVLGGHPRLDVLHRLRLYGVFEMIALIIDSPFPVLERRIPIIRDHVPVCHGRLPMIGATAVSHDHWQATRSPGHCG